MAALTLPLLFSASAFGCVAFDDTITEAEAPFPSEDLLAPEPPIAAPSAPGCGIGIDEVATTLLVVDAAGDFRVWLNGVLVDDHVGRALEPQVYEVAIFRHPARTNVLAIEARDAGFTAELGTEAIGPAVAPTEATWRVTEDAGVVFARRGFRVLDTSCAR
jgi:hypothetical protein